MLFSHKAARALLSAGVLAAGLLAGHAPTPTPAHAAVIQVETLADNTTADGDCSLREAINNANANALLHGDCLAGTVAIDVISFSVSGTITLTSTLTITAGGPLSIFGPSGGITISGGNATRPLTINGGSSVTIDSLTIANGDTLDGGGISNAGVLTLLNSTLRDNTAAGSGGAIQNLGQLFVGNSTFTGNDAPTGNGGAINTLVQLVMSNSTVAGNSTSGSGGGIRVQAGVATVQNTILADNSAATGPNCSGSLTAGGHNVVHDTAGCTIAGGTLAVADPVLDVLADNGGPVFTMALLDGSPALNTGDATVCANATLVDNEDQRGVIRPQGPACDVGAYEERHFVMNSTSDVVDVTPGNGTCATAGGVCTLRAAIMEANALEGPTTATFSISGTHTLSIGPLPNIAKRLVIDGTGQTVTVNANGLGRVFNILGGGALRGLTLTGGNPGGSGGGVLTGGSGALTIDKSVIQGNHAANGGGVFHSSSGQLTIIDTTVAGNTAGFDGGGVFVNLTGANLVNSTISGNTATDDGGGVYHNVPVFLVNSTISGNAANGVDLGGGGGILSSLGSALTVVNSTIAGNTTNSLGGGLFRLANTGTLKNTIIAGNTGLADNNCGGNYSGAGANLVQGGVSAGCTITGGTLLTGNPLLAPLANNGGPTQTRACPSAVPPLMRATAQSVRPAPSAARTNAGWRAHPRATVTWAPTRCPTSWSTRCWIRPTPAPATGHAPRPGAYARYGLRCRRRTRLMWRASPRSA